MPAAGHRQQWVWHTRHPSNPSVRPRVRSMSRQSMWTVIHSLAQRQ